MCLVAAEVEGRCGTLAVLGQRNADVLTAGAGACFGSRVNGKHCTCELVWSEQIARACLREAALPGHKNLTLKLAGIAWAGGMTVAAHPDEPLVL